MYMVSSGSEVEIYYDSPSEDLRSASVTHGTLKFKGQKNGLHYEGELRAFKQDCEEFILPNWSGSESADHTVITLEGLAPVVNHYCEVIGERPGNVKFKAYNPEISSNPMTDPRSFAKRNSSRKPE